jgi:hypothetical protein
MPKKRKSAKSPIIAAAMRKGDKFKMGGTKYIMLEDATSSFGRMELVFTTVKEVTPRPTRHTMFVPGWTTFNISNRI